MRSELVVRAWKDPKFRASLSAEQRAMLPDNPSGSSIAELNGAEREDALGGHAFFALKSTQTTDCSFILTGCVHTQCQC